MSMVFSWWGSVPGSGDFWEGSGTPRDEEAGEEAQAGGIRDFSRISTTENGVVKKV